MCPIPRDKTLARIVAWQRRPRLPRLPTGLSNTIMVSEDAGRPDLYLAAAWSRSAPSSPGIKGVIR